MAAYYNEHDKEGEKTQMGQPKRMLDLFCGRWGWSRAFAARGWECVGVDLTEPPEIPPNCEFFQMDVLDLDSSLELGRLPYSEGWKYDVSMFDFICASSPCEEFSVHGMRHFFPNPPYPELGIRLFNHTRALCEQSGLPYVMENVRAAEMFVGTAAHHCGPFYLWGTGVPLLLNQGIKKGLNMGRDPITGKRHSNPVRDAWSGSEKRKEATAKLATIPPELSSCVADYAERILELSSD